MTGKRFGLPGRPTSPSPSTLWLRLAGRVGIGAPPTAELSGPGRSRGRGGARRLPPNDPLSAPSPPVPPPANADSELERRMEKVQAAAGIIFVSAQDTLLRLEEG